MIIYNLHCGFYSITVEHFMDPTFESFFARVIDKDNPYFSSVPFIRSADEFDQVEG